MKKTKRILALIGIILLISIYVLFLIGAFTASHSSALFRAGLYLVFAVPIMIYAYLLIYRLVKKNAKDNDTKK